MKYYDENDVEIPEEDIDLENGYVILEQKVKEHHDAIPEVNEESHYEVSTFYFEDGTSLTVESMDDPHIKPINPEIGVFEYEDQGEGKVCRGIDLKTVVDVEHEEAKEAYDEYEDFYRYIPYSEEEIAERKKAQEEQQKREEFLVAGPDKLEQATTKLEENTSRLDNAEIELGDLSVALVEILEAM